MDTKKNIKKNEINRVLDSLAEQEALVIRLRFGMLDGKRKTLDEIGDIFGLTRERIRQIEERALRKLRHPSRSLILKDYFYLIGTSKKRLRLIRGHYIIFVH